MNDKIFFDTNVLVYMQSGFDTSKTNICRQLFERNATDNLIVLSTQILQEFFITMTRKLGHDPITVKDIIILFAEFEIVTNTQHLIFQAIDISVLHKLSFWDSLVVSAAAAANCKTIYSEDMNHGQMIRGVEIINPFKG